jgi:hypothetical protein
VSVPSGERHLYVCENCARLGPIEAFQDECSPGWTHGRLIKIGERRDAIAAEVAQLRQALERAAYLADHLLQQVPEFTGVVSPDGHKEDDIRERLAAEIDEWAALGASRPGQEQETT